MSTKSDGGYAFPWCGDLNETPFINLGLTIRDYFAAKAMEGYFASFAGHTSDPLHPDFMDSNAKRIYEFADAMLKARGE